MYVANCFHFYFSLIYVSASSDISFNCFLRRFSECCYFYMVITVMDNAYLISLSGKSDTGFASGYDDPDCDHD